MKYKLRALLSLPFAAATLVGRMPLKSPPAQKSPVSKGPLREPNGVSTASGLEDSLVMRRITGTNVDVFAVRDDGSQQLLASGLNTKELVDLQHWWRYTKPLGFDVRIIVRAADSLPIIGFSTTGTEPALAAEVPCPRSLSVNRHVPQEVDCSQMCGDRG
jgi:hypothetical protein